MQVANHAQLMPLHPEVKPFALGAAQAPMPIGSSNEPFSVDPKVQQAKTMTSEDKQDAELMKSCQQLEGALFNIMLKEMRKTVQKSGLLEDQQNQEEIYTEMMDQNIADKMAEDDSSDTGLANLMYMQLTGKQAYHAHLHLLAGAGSVKGKDGDRGKADGKETNAK